MANYTYLFIAEMDSDVKKIRTLMNGIGKVRKLQRLLNPVYVEEFGCVCGQPIYQIKTNIMLSDLADMWRDNIPDSHYCYQSLNHSSIFTGERYLKDDDATTIQAETLQQEVVSNKEYWFDTGVWFHIKGFAGWSDNYPVNLPYYKFMTGDTSSHLPSCYRYCRRINSLDIYIDHLIEMSDNLEDRLILEFAPKPKPKTWEQMRIEWDAKYGEGSFDDDSYC